jgi:hypothetical protein
MGFRASSTYTLGKYVVFDSKNLYKIYFTGMIFMDRLGSLKVNKMYNAEMFILATLMMTFTS